MNYETVLLELLSRVQKIEMELIALKKTTDQNQNILPIKTKPGQTQTSRVREYIKLQKQAAKDRGEQSIILRAGDIEKAVGLKNRPVIVCNAMRQLMVEGDRVIEAPPSGTSTTVRIEYFL